MKPSSGGLAPGCFVQLLTSSLCCVQVSDGGGNELLVTGTDSCSSGCVEQICTGHKSYKAQLSPPLLLLLLRFATRASQERLSAAAGDHGVLEQPGACVLENAAALRSGVKPA
ncbi:unnamed protein product [Pleuronectes platessa]|uniref:Secreted protein n=1 Tax=Pleuronectes platessa TaxID=8262 RepID=A0A9N7V4F9_PLEPL|nr:unnamed protein product [Pleuronectes platessa]